MSTIDRQAAIDGKITIQRTNGVEIYPSDVVPVTYLEKLPSVQPKRKTGKWIWDVNGMDWVLGAWCCSECGIKPETWWATNKKLNPLRCSGGNFCGICGADMRERQKE